MNILKRVDSVFKKGLFYYADPETPRISRSASVFFRKESFGSDLNLGSRQDAPLSVVENWCNAFAFYLLIGKENATLLDSISRFDGSNDYGHDLVKRISETTNISRLAIFTNLLLQRKLSYDAYQNIKDEIMEELRERDARKALSSGVIGEQEYCKAMKIKPSEINAFRYL